MTGNAYRLHRDAMSRVISRWSCFLSATSNPESITSPGSPKELARSRRKRQGDSRRDATTFLEARGSLITRFLAGNSLAPSLQNEGRRNRPVTHDKGDGFCSFTDDPPSNVGSLAPSRAITRGNLACLTRSTRSPLSFRGRGRSYLSRSEADLLGVRLKFKKPF